MAKKTERVYCPGGGPASQFGNTPAALRLAEILERDPIRGSVSKFFSEHNAALKALEESYFGDNVADSLMKAIRFYYTHKVEELFHGHPSITYLRNVMRVRQKLAGERIRKWASISPV